jgi:putative nucleotidyltransferase with HDIG domain
VDTIISMLLRAAAAALMAGVLVLHKTWPVQPLIIVGLFALSLGTGILVRQTLRKIPNRLVTPAQAERALALAMFVGAAGAQLVVRVVGTTESAQSFLFIAPLSAQAMLAAVMLGAPVSVIGVTVTTLLLGMAGVTESYVLLPAWICASAAANLISPLKRRSHLLRAVSILIVVQAVAAASTAAVIGFSSIQIGESIVWGAVGAVMAASLFWLGSTVVEKMLGITSDWSLLELCGPDHPLIHELCIKAPGTYAHSIMVGNLSEAAARSIGASPVACRAMAMFHDIGKMLRPACFIENQSGHNCHDDFEPSMSARLIRGHVSEGMEMGRRHKLPKIILDGIEQHHGTMVVGYFLNKELELHPHLDPNETKERFRHKGPKPQTRESAILHLADMIEAASRTLKPDQSIDDLIDRIFAASQADGQLDECTLTFRDLSDIKSSFSHVLSATRHQRIDYPGQETEDEESDQHHRPEPIEPTNPA